MFAETVVETQVGTVARSKVTRSGYYPPIVAWMEVSYA
jgi:hypothetical protein